MEEDNKFKSLLCQVNKENEEITKIYWRIDSYKI